MPASNRLQALAPEGACVLSNEAGTAPGLCAALDAATVFALPGVPVEMKAMFERHLAPFLAANTRSAVAVCRLNTIGLGESAIGEALADLMGRDRQPLVGTTASAGCVSVRIRGEFSRLDEAQSAVLRTADEVRTRLGSAVYSEGEESLGAVVGRLLQAQGATVATAESCTAGLLAFLLTEPPGASAWFVGGWVVYANSLKRSALGVPGDVLVRDGAVSESVACSMALQALERAGSDYALALTGVAGPGGGSAEKPTGTVWMALARRTAGFPEARAECWRLAGPRDAVRERAARTALNRLRLALLNPSQTPAG